MDIEKSIELSATPAELWSLLLDPQIMAGCVPGMQSIDVISETEYLVSLKVKISFVTASFKIRTHILEQRAPNYLKSAGVGEDAALASSLKHQSEIFITPTSDGRTELRIMTHVDVLGRVGTFGLSAMKTKTDRMWDEFAEILKSKLESELLASKLHR
jgi:carbon monoxide dehydrogenase subunit G